MQRFSEFAAFPLVAGALGAASAFLAASIGAAPETAVAIGVAMFAAAVALRNWSVAEADRPLLAEELTGLHERLDAMQEDAADLRELLTDLAAIVEEAAAREHSAMSALGARVARLEESPAADPDTIELTALQRMQEAMEPIADRLEHFDARTRKLALALEKGLGAPQTEAFAAETMVDTALDAALDAARDTAGHSVEAPRRLDMAAEEQTGRGEAEAAPEAPRAESSMEQAAKEAARDYALMLQAVFSVPDGEPRFFEAYTRRIREDGSIAPTADHVIEAKAAGDVAEIDNLLLTRCIAAAEQFRVGGRDVAVFCNISMLSLRDPATLRLFLGFLRENAQLSRHLVFEFSQIELDDFHDPDIAILQRLRETGFVFSIDHLDDWSIDIGNLVKIGFRYVKLDAGALLAREEKNPGATLRLARSFERAGLSLIVEKVETVREAERLEAAGARFLQGAALAEPRLIRVDDDAFSNLELAARRAVASGSGLDDDGAEPPLDLRRDAPDEAAASTRPSAGERLLGGDRGVLERAMRALGPWPPAGATAHHRPD